MGLFNRELSKEDIKNMEEALHIIENKGSARLEFITKIANHLRLKETNFHHPPTFE